MSQRLIVIGAGPGGYAAAFAAADAGIPVTLIDQDPALGGVCLNRGCIPSKALLHLAKIITDAREAAALGVAFGTPEIDLDKIRAFKQGVVTRLTSGLAQLARQRKVEIIQGRASFLTPRLVAVFKPDGGHLEIEFDTAILATGSLPVGLPFAPAAPGIWDSTAALDLPCIPKRLLVVGGGYIGMELATVYQALGSAITVVEMTPTLLPGADRDLVVTLQKRARGLFQDIKLSTRVTSITEADNGFRVTFENAQGETGAEEFDHILVAVGRKNVFDGLGLVNTGVTLTDDKKFIRVDARGRTTDPNIYAIGDIAGQPMLAHKATADARAAVDAIRGVTDSGHPKTIPAVVFTDPEIAWCGLTENEAKEKGLAVTVSKFPWAASGRAATLNRADGVTKIIADTATGRVLGVAIAGPGAGELIAEGVLAVESGVKAESLAAAVHPHPTLSETLMEAAEGVIGQSLHFYRPVHNKK